MVTCWLLPFLALGLWASVSFVTACPAGCSCSSGNSGVTADCSARGLTEIPTQGIDANTRILNLAGNQLTSIPAGFLASYPDVQELYFENNRIEVLEPLAFSGFKLTKLKLRGNRIREISGQTFKDVQGQCDPETFKFIKETVVKFNRWPIQDLNEQGDWPCAIDLRDNPITKVKSRAFSDSQKFTVYLGDSHIGMTVEGEAFANTDNVLGVHIIKVPSLTLSSGAFDKMGSVGWIWIDQTAISLTGQPFGTTTRPRWIRFSNSNFLQLERAAFTLTMDISSQCRVQTFPFGPGRQLTNTIATLQKGGIELVGNTLPLLPAGLLNNTKLGGIHFHGNTIGGFGRGVFERSGEPSPICLIIFSENQYDEIASEAFKNTRDITHFIMNLKNIKAINANAFIGSRNIEEMKIVIANNDEIDQVTIKSNAFRNISSAKIVTIRRDDSSPGKPGLTIEPNAFLEFNGTDYMTVILDPSMTILPDNLFTGLTVKQRFILELSGVTSIHAKAFGCPGRSSIERLIVDGTFSLPCDCETSRLSEYVKQNVKFQEGITCSGSLNTIATNCTMQNCEDKSDGNTGTSKANNLYHSMEILLVFIIACIFW